ncbi:ATP-binding protein [uncultured Flavobacterium sp.]|uniref:sensor histidine kinase n=1 Tax=uncultured Flavobacterium sp. TaxID=165435 RepID=UPI0025ECB971|nr:ATP-binding protein [uncultured Flavobacterium sp.]
MEKWQDPKVIAIWITIIVALVFTIILFVVKIMHAGYKRMTEANLREVQTRLEHQKKLMETNLQAQEKERGRIAADLHDSLIGKLTLIRMKSQIGAALPEIEGLLGESITEARRISHDLTPPLLEFSRAEELIENVLNPWKEKMAIEFYSDVRVNADLTPDVKIQLLRVAQELLTNTIKHAEATKVQVGFRHTDKAIVLSFSDNGKGFDSHQLKKGLGLNSLEFRMQYLNAKYKVKSAIGKGTTTFMAASV